MTTIFFFFLSSIVRSTFFRFLKFRPFPPVPRSFVILLFRATPCDRDTPHPSQAGGLFVGQPISELHLSSSVALVLCLRPRLPQPPLVVEANMSRREKLARELVENGQANVPGGDGDEEVERKEPTLKEQVRGGYVKKKQIKGRGT